MNTEPEQPESGLDGIIAAISERLNHDHFILSVSHSNYLSSLGGTEKLLMEEQQAFFGHRISYIQIYPLDRQVRREVQTAPDQMVGINVDASPVESMTLLQLCVVLQSMISRNGIRPSAVHLHHLMNMSLFGVGVLIDALAPSTVRFFIHDYFTICSSFNLLTDDNVYCGMGSSETACCQGCTRCRNRVGHLARMRSFFSRLKPEVVAPSTTAKTIWSDYFPDLEDRIRVVPHQIRVPVKDHGGIPAVQSSASESPIKVAYLGYESANKGLETWWRLLADARIRHAFDFYHLGAAGKKIPGVTYVPVSFQQDGPDAMVDALTTHGIDVAFLWSIWPETYSFTVFEALAAGCAVITNGISGNIRAQVVESGRGLVFETESEMLRFFSDPLQVRKRMAAEHALKGRRFQLLFNPRIAEETARHSQPARPPISSNRDMDAYQVRCQNNWFSALRLFSAACAQRDDIRPLTDRIDGLQARLNVYQRSRLHRMVEAVRGWFTRHPVVGNRVRPFVVRLSKLFFQFFNSKEV